MRAIFAFTSFHEGVRQVGFEILSQISEQETKRGLGWSPPVGEVSPKATEGLTDRLYPQLNVIMTGEACQYHY